MKLPLRSPACHGGHARLGLSALAIAATAGLLACGAGGTQSGSAFGAATERTGQPIIVTRNGASKATCGPRSMGKRLQGLAKALHDVDTKALKSYWGKDLDGFFILRRHGHAWFETRSYRDGVAQLQKQGGLRIRFKEVEVDGRGNIRYDGFFWTPKSVKKALHGKAGVACDSPTILRLASFTSKLGSKGNDVADCPRPDGQVPANALIACFSRE